MGRTKKNIILIIITTTTTYINLYLYAVNPNLYTEIMIIHLVWQEFELVVYLQLHLTLLEIFVILYTTLSMTTKTNSVVPIKNLLTKIFIVLDFSNRSNKTIMIQVVQELNITGNRF